MYRPDVVEHAYCCGKCGKYFRLGARNRLRMVLDKGSFQAWDEGIRERNPLQDAAYGEKLDSLKGNSGLDEAVITGVGTIGRYPVRHCRVGHPVSHGKHGYGGRRKADPGL